VRAELRAVKASCFSRAWNAYRSTQSDRVGSQSSPSMYSERMYPMSLSAFVIIFPLDRRMTSSSRRYTEPSGCRCTGSIVPSQLALQVVLR
jgi:hypothetical protein